MSQHFPHDVIHIFLRFVALLDGIDGLANLDRFVRKHSSLQGESHLSHVRRFKLNEGKSGGLAFAIPRQFRRRDMACTAKELPQGVLVNHRVEVPHIDGSSNQRFV